MMPSRATIVVIVVVLLAFGLGLLVRGLFAPPPSSAASHADHAGHDPTALTLDAHDVAMAEVTTASVERRPLIRHLRAVGTVGYNEAGVTTVPSRVQGYVEKLFVSAVGVTVHAGDHLAEIYSPDLTVGHHGWRLSCIGMLHEPAGRCGAWSSARIRGVVRAQPCGIFATTPVKVDRGGVQRRHQL